MAGMYPENQELSIFGEKVQWPGLDKNGKFTNGSFTDPLEKPSFIPAETLNLVLDNLGGLITKLGGTPNNTSAEQLAELFVSAAAANKGIMRDAAGRAQVAAPSAAADIARKAEVDAAVRFASGFGVCETESGGTGKNVTIEGAELRVGRRICVKFTHGNTASEPTLNVNNLGAKLITMDGQPVYTGCFDAGGVYEFVYDGTNWECLSGVVRARSFGDNSGYVKYRNGLLVQFGFCTSYVITFPHAFTTFYVPMRSVIINDKNISYNHQQTLRVKSLTHLSWGQMWTSYWLAVGF